MSNTTALNTQSCPGFAASSTVNVLRYVTCLPPGSPPQVIVPEEQIYYWSPEWQNAEYAAMDELRRGLGVRFDDAKDAIRWLLGDGE